MTRALLLWVLLVPALAAAQSEAGSSNPDLGVLRQPLMGEPAGPPLTGEALEEATRQLGGRMRCPVCQGLSIADSPAEVARNMLGQVKDLLAAGYSETQIEQYFEASYGEFVYLEPKKEGFNLLVWFGPPLGLLLGLLLVFLRLRAPASQPDDELLPYLERVRREVAGGEA